MEAVITSAQNPKVKQLRRLASSAKARRDENLYIAEGIHLVQSCIVAGGDVSLGVYAESALKNREIMELRERLDETRITQVVLTDSLFESIASVHAGVGILVVFTPQAPEVTNVLPLSADTVLLDNVQDPSNIGAIMRTVAATGIRDVLLSSGCASPWSPKALRAGMGAQFSLDIYESVNLMEALNTPTMPVCVTALSDGSVSLYDADLSRPVAWIFGSEGQGVDAELIKAADVRIKIPQVESAVESLNVASAAAVCLYERYRQAMQNA